MRIPRLEPRRTKVRAQDKDDRLSVALFDSVTFHAFRRFIEGPIRGVEDLQIAERLVRAIVLHDEAILEEPPLQRPDGPDEESEELARLNGGLVITAFSAHIEPRFDGLLLSHAAPHVELAGPAPWMHERARACSGAGPGDAFYNSHLSYCRTVAGVLDRDGSVVYESGYAELDGVGTPSAADVLPGLDAQWRDLIRSVERGVGLDLPPLLAVVMSRAQHRDAIVGVIRDLRDEWASPRRKVWELLRVMRHGSLKERAAASRELEAASALFNPTGPTTTIPVVRAIWEVFSGAAFSIAGSLTGGADPVTAASGGLGVFLKDALSAMHREDWSLVADQLFRRGAFDLARRVRVALADVEPVRILLARHLSAEELSSLGL
jgi:hypothetical protein